MSIYLLNLIFWQCFLNFGNYRNTLARLIIGARYNVSLANVYEGLESLQHPSYTSEDAKNNVIQISVGWRFGKNGKKAGKGK